MAKRFVSIGECMIEMSEAGDGLYRLGFAGDTLNTAWYARARLPAEWSVDYLTALGEDRYSAQMRGFLAAAGIGTGHIQTIPGRRPGLYLIHQEGGDRQFTYWRDLAAVRWLMEDRPAVDAALHGADMIYFSGITMAIFAPRQRGRLLKAIVTARDAGATVVFDPNIRPALWTGPRAMQAVLMTAAGISDIVLPTFGDDAALFGDADPDATATRYLEAGAREVVVKNGGNAALARTGTERSSVEPAGDVTLVDPTGAGDSFNGAYLAARLAGADLAQSLRQAHRVAGVVVGQRGALVRPEAFEG